MPCGGIYPMTIGGPCWVCNKDGCDHYCEEWDTGLHAECVVPFLAKHPEGEIVLAHKHPIYIEFKREDAA